MEGTVAPRARPGRCACASKVRPQDSKKIVPFLFLASGSSFLVAENPVLF